MNASIRGVFLVCCLMLAACTIKQSVEPIHEQQETAICIIEDPAVREGFLEAYQRALRDKGYAVRMLPKGSSLQECPLTTTYMGRWSWDLAIYLSYARIEVFRNGQRVGVAEYDSRSGGVNMGKFIKGEKKVVELVDKLFTSRAGAGNAAKTPSPAPAQ